MKNTKKKTKEEISQILIKAREANSQGISNKRYCLENSLNYETFKNWKYKRKAAETQIHGFTKIQKNIAPAADAIVIEYKGAKILAANERQLCAVLSALN